MIDGAFLQEIGLTDDQISLFMDAKDKEDGFRDLLHQEGVHPGAAESIIKITKLKDVDLSNKELLREKIRTEWHNFIINKC